MCTEEISASSARKVVARSRITSSKTIIMSVAALYLVGRRGTRAFQPHPSFSRVMTSLFSTAPKQRNTKRGKDKRREFIGMAKAVDRGQWNTTYQPFNDGKFHALSGLPSRSEPFTVLGIESSCDDTGAAVVRSDGFILGEALASQQDIHEQWGGVVPGLARDAHVENIDTVINEALLNANMTMEQVDAIGVTVGPGLAICLRVGCNKARELAIQYKKPFVGNHHLEAHILMARLPDEENGDSVIVSATEETHESKRAMDFPFLALLVSGGHCQLLKCLGIGRYEIMGGTIDDSLGKCSCWSNTYEMYFYL